MSSHDAPYPPNPPRPQPYPHPAYPHPGVPSFAGHGPWSLPPKPGIVPLAPLRLGDYVNATIALIAKHLLVLLALGAITGVLVGVFTALTTAVIMQATAVSEGYGAGLVGLILLSFALLVATLAMNFAFLALYVGVGVIAGRGSLGQVASGADVARVIRSVLNPLLVLSVLYLIVEVILGVAVMAITLLPIFGVIGMNDVDNFSPPVLVGLFVSLFVALIVVPLLSIPLAYLAARLAPALVALALERQANGAPLGAIAALRRSWQLTQGNGWRLLGITLLYGLVLGTASTLVTIPLNFLAVVPSVAVSTTISGLSGAVAAILIIPIKACVPAIAYLDMRLRKEDLGAQIARQVGLT